MTDKQAAYKLANIEEYEGYRRVGRTEDADVVATILRDHYGHDVTKDADKSKGKVTAKPATGEPERADDKAPEDTAEHSPAQRRSPRAKKTEQ
jgi:hypothetical protein